MGTCQHEINKKDLSKMKFISALLQFVLYLSLIVLLPFLMAAIWITHEMDPVARAVAFGFGTYGFIGLFAPLRRSFRQMRAITKEAIDDL